MSTGVTVRLAFVICPYAARTGEVPSLFTGHADGGVSVVFSPDGQTPHQWWLGC